MRWWMVGLGSVLALSLATGCSEAAQRTAREEVDKYNMKSYNRGNQRQLSSGITINSALLDALKSECSEHSIRLTHETYVESLDGTVSYSYFVNGDARHFVNVHVFQSEDDRVRVLKETYGAAYANSSIDGANSNRAADEAYVLAEKGKTALIYISSGAQQSKYGSDFKSIFEAVLDRAIDRSPK